MATGLSEVFSNIWTWIYSFLNQLLPKYLFPNIQLIIQVVILLVVAWIIGKIGKMLVVKLLNVTGLRKITKKSWAEDVLKITGYKGTIIELLGDMIKWLIYILFLALIIQLAGLPGVADIFSQIAIVMPRIIGAVFIVVIGFIIADFFSKVFEEASGRVFKEDIMSLFIGGIAKYTVAIISVIIALSLLGLDTLSLTIMFAILMTTVAVILLFGLKDMIPNYSSGMQVRAIIKVGERIKIGEWEGIVEKINPTTTTLKNGKKKIMIPNSYFARIPVEKH